jgi:pimeloyl-ACP methyl ester carboxylesterase
MPLQKLKISDALELAYSEEGEGETVVLIHGYCGSYQYWDKIIPLLSSQYRIIAVDLRGHGMSSAPEESYSMEAMAEDIYRLLEHLEVEQVQLFGHSLGGYITLAFAENYPDKLRSWGLIHSTAYPDSEEGKANRGKAIQSIRTGGMEAFMEGLAPKLFAAAHKETMASYISQVKHIGYSTSITGAIAAAEGMRDRPDRRHVIEQSAVPVLLIAGGGDQVIPPEKTFTAEGPRISQARLEGAGHMSMYETPEQLASVLREFLMTS